MRTCDVEDCDNKHRGKGYCVKHYQRFIKWGTPHYRDTRGGGGVRKETLTYNGIHTHLRQQFGPASLHTCAFCGEDADDWAFVEDWCDAVQYETKLDYKGKEYELAYSSDPAHYITLCRQDHRSYDAGISPSWELSMGA